MEHYARPPFDKLGQPLKQVLSAADDEIEADKVVRPVAEAEPSVQSQKRHRRVEQISICLVEDARPHEGGVHSLEERHKPVGGCPQVLGSCEVFEPSVEEGFAQDEEAGVKSY